ncbi:MAG: hypothetical protein JRN66_06945 [Nitrososphaerota archaeon]|nr:hypothetical protein [Nitrososphaerota archaeon]
MTNTTTVEIHLSEPGNKNSMRVVFPEFKSWVAVDGASGIALQYLISRFGTRIRKNTFETTDLELIDLGRNLSKANRHNKNEIIFETARKIVRREPNPHRPNASLDFGLVRATRLTLNGQNGSNVAEIVLTRCQGLINLFTFLGKTSTLLRVTKDNRFELEICQEAFAKVLTASKSRLGGICMAFDPDNPGGYDVMVRGVERAEKRKRILEAKFRALISGNPVTRRTPVGNVTITLSKTKPSRKDLHPTTYDMTMILRGNAITVTNIMRWCSKDSVIQSLKGRPLEPMERSYTMKTPNLVTSPSRYEFGNVEWSDVLTAVAKDIPITAVMALNPDKGEW